MPASSAASFRLWRSGLALAALLLCSTGVLADHALEKEELIAFRDGIENFEEVQAAWGLSGWCTAAGGDDDCSAPLCTWGGVECDGYHVHTGNFVTTLRLTCKGCAVPLRGRLRPGLHRLQHLEYLHLEGNELEGPLPPEWGEPCSFNELLEFNVNDNQLTGNMPESWSIGPAFKVLADLQMANNRFSGTFPAGFAITNTSFVSVMSFSFADNQFSGTLPNYVNGMITMAVAAMHNNRFTGTLPPEWGLQGYWWNATLNNTQALEYLFLHGNNLTGGIPDTWAALGSFTVLKQLTLSDNPNLGGTLPAAWGNTSEALQALENVNASKCGLTGTLPPWGSAGLQKLRVLTLTDNDLSGSIPASWTELASLEELTIQPGNEKLCPTRPEGANFVVCNSIDLLCDGREELPSNSSYCAAGQAGAAAGGGGGDSSDGDGDGFPVAAVAVPVAVACTLALALAGLAWRRYRARAAAKGSGGSKGAMYKDAESGLFYDAAGMPLPPGNGGAHDTDRDAGVTTAQFGSNGSASWLPCLTNHSAELDTLPSDCNISPPNGFAPSGLHHTSSTDGTTTTSSHLGTADGAANGDNPCFTSRELAALQLSDWEIGPEDIQILKRQNGSDWQLGSGGFGTVYKAMRNGVQPVAVKVLGTANSKIMSHSEFAREISILRACRDTNILQFQGACFQDKRTLLVTEYMEGGNLAHNLRAQKVAWYRRGKKIALDVARALVYLHARKIVHLDIKSANVLLTRDGNAKVGDVGMAKIMAGDYVSGVVGTLAWSAPELLMGQRCAAKADVYSFGVVLWEICTGELPVRGQLRDPRVPGECPSEVLHLMYRCLSPDPAARPSSTELVELLLQSPGTPNPSRVLPADGGAGAGALPALAGGGAAAASGQACPTAAAPSAAQRAGRAEGAAPDAACTPSSRASSGGPPSAPPLPLVQEASAGWARRDDGAAVVLRDAGEEEALEEVLIEELVSESAPNSGTYHLSGGAASGGSGELQRRLVLPPAGSLSTASPFVQAAKPPASPFTKQQQPQRQQQQPQQ